MDTAVINVKIDPKVKLQAQKTAKKLGFTLSALINGYLRQFINTKTVHFSNSEEPSEYLLESIREAQEDIKKGRVSSAFDNAKDAINYLNNLIKKDKNLHK